MITDFLFSALVLVGVIGILIVVLRKANSLDDKEVARIFYEHPLFIWWTRFKEERLRSVFNIQKIEERFVIWLEKTLRFLHVLLLRLDNGLHQKIQQVRELRSFRKFDSDYWFNLRSLAAGRQIGRMSRNIRKNYHQELLDPIKEELFLRKQRNVEAERWLNLVRFYLAKEDLSEAGRVLIQYWQENKQDEKIFLFVETIYIKTKEKEAASSLGQKPKR